MLGRAQLLPPGVDKCIKLGIQIWGQHQRGEATGPVGQVGVCVLVVYHPPAGGGREEGGGELEKKNEPPFSNADQQVPLRALSRPAAQS